MKNSTAAWGAILALTGVIFGAFGTHTLRESIGPEAVASFLTGTQYQIYHSLAILLVWAASRFHSHPLFKWAARLFIAGIVLFSGSIYLLATSELTGIPKAAAGPVTPLGGLCFMAGWLMTIIAFFSKPWSK